jgi:hypothetical protein
VAVAAVLAQKMAVAAQAVAAEILVTVEIVIQAAHLVTKVVATDKTVVMQVAIKVVLVAVAVAIVEAPTEIFLTETAVAAAAEAVAVAPAGL